MSEKFDLITICGQELAKYVEGIDFETLINLQPEQIKEAIPNVIHRIMFENRLKKYKQTIEIAPTQEVSNLIEIESDNTYNHISLPAFDSDFSLINVTSNNATLVNDSICLSKDQLRKKTEIKTVQDIIDIPDVDLKIVITRYVGKTVMMENIDRIVIGKAVIHHLLVHDLERMVARPEFIDLARLIVQLFPLESAGTYYTPAVKSSPAQGKLYSAYQNYRTQLGLVGLIKKRDKTQEDENENVETVRVAAQEKSEALKLVLETHDDFEQIKKAWQSCYNERQILVHEFTVFEYMRRFPAFDFSKGYELLLLDADAEYKNLVSTLQQLAHNLIDFASQKRRPKDEFKNLITAYRELAVDIEEESSEIQSLQKIFAIRILPYLMPNPKKKLSASEIAKLFCPYFKTAFEADSFNIKFHETYKDSALILKPRLYFFGNLSNPSAHIHIGSYKYVVENAVFGFEILFKSFLALKCPYPDETKHIWCFIEKELYGIDSGSKQNANVETFIQDFKFFITNSNT